MIVNQIGTSGSSSDNAEIGDIKITARTDLGDKWLLCNGAEVSAQDYSELAELLPLLSRAWATKDLWSMSGYGNNEINCIAYGNGYWVAGGQYYNGSDYYNRIAYTKDPIDTWTTKDLWSSTSIGFNRINCVTYANGYWVVGGEFYDWNSGRGGARIAYTTSPTGTWTTKDMWYGDTDACINCLANGDGYFLVGGYYYNSHTQFAKIGYTDPKFDKHSSNISERSLRLHQGQELTHFRCRKTNI